jgi:site-specific DNA recombinase
MKDISHNLSHVIAAIYARVSSEKQAKAGTINSQVESILNRVKEDGLTVEPELYFIDDGYSGSTLIRPALERLRDQAAAGSFNRLYVYNPFRLSRNYAYQVLLIDELKRSGVEIIFLNHKFSDNPEEKLLLQVQGMIAEYERAKIQERSRRGKLHAAQKGSVNVLSCAPYGYRYITKSEGAGSAAYEILLEEAKVVRQVFEWAAIDGYSISKICKCLQEKEILTRYGNKRWDRSAVWGMLKNPAYKGTAAFGKIKNGELRPRLRVYKRSQEQPRRAYSKYRAAEEDWILISVPPIINEKLFQTVQEQLKENQKRSRERKQGASYLLQGLLVCKKCGYAYYGITSGNAISQGKKNNRSYYRCSGTDAGRFGGTRVCENKPLRTELLEQAVWNDIYELLADPGRIEEEYKRRLTIPQNNLQWNSMQQVKSRIKAIKRGVSRLIDSYEEGLIDKEEFEPRIKMAKQKLQKLEGEIGKQIADAEQIKTLQLVIGKMKDFADKIKDNLTNTDWTTRREIIRALVKQIEIDAGEVNIVYKIAPDSLISDSNKPEKGNLQYCRRRHFPHQNNTKPFFQEKF